MIIRKRRRRQGLIILGLGPETNGSGMISEDLDEIRGKQQSTISAPGGQGWQDKGTPVPKNKKDPEI